MQPFPKRHSQEHKQTNAEEERKGLLRQIAAKQDALNNLQKKINDQHHKCQKVRQHNARQQKRMMRYKARIQEMNKHRDNPQHFLTMSGYMNQYIQQYILSHNLFLEVNPNEPLNPDNMTYEQLIELGDQIGKVSKGLTKEEIELLKHRKGRKDDDSCPVCQNEVQVKDDVIELKCGHSYHQDCILFWLRDENTCPICKQYLGEAKGESEKMLNE